MGGSQSKTVVNNLSESISNIASSTVQNCVVNSDQVQDLGYNNTGFSFWTTVKATQTTDVSIQCFSDSAKQSQLQNDIINLIAQSATTKGVALLDAFAAPGSSAIANLTNIVRNNVTMSNIQAQYTTIKQTQKAPISNSGISIFSSFDISQGAKVFAMSTVKVMENAGILNAISNHVDQSASTTTENPLNFLANIASAITGGLVTGIAGAVMFFIFLIILIFGGFYAFTSLIGRGVGSAASGVANGVGSVATGIGSVAGIGAPNIPPLVDMAEFNETNNAANNEQSNQYVIDEENIAADNIAIESTDNVENTDNIAQ